MAGTSPLSAVTPSQQLVTAQNQTALAGLTGSSSASTSSGTSTSALTASLGADAFLKLLTTQLSNQDPLKPMDDTQSVSQLAQFSALQASTNLSDQFTKFQSNFSIMQSASLIGAKASVNAPNAAGDSSTISGTINGVQIVKGIPNYTMTDTAGKTILDATGKNPLLFTGSQILSLH